VNRQDLRRLATIRLREGRTLYSTGLYSGAYYLSGYAVECALKACIAKSTRKSEFPNKSLAVDAWKHDLNALVKTAGLLAARTVAFDADDQLEVNWSTVKDWSSESRYDPAVPKKKASDIIDAISDDPHGVMLWLKQHW
jgi:HEPN domain-containing protein